MCYRRDSFLKPVIFRFIAKPSLGCTLTKRLKTISNRNQSKTTKEQVKLE